ncbi:MAG: diguanylate cyclase [Pseudomonadota bacterium]
MNALIIESSKFWNQVLRDLLASVGFKSESVFTGVDGIQQLTAQNYDLILVARHLDDISGLDVCEFYCGQDRHAPVYLITTQESDDTLALALRCGATDVFFKSALEKLRMHLIQMRMTPDSAFHRSADILLVEKGSQVLQFMRDSFTPLGMKVVDMDTTDAALAWIDSNHVDLVVLDLTCDGKIDAEKLIKDIRHQSNFLKSRIPILLFCKVENKKQALSLLTLGGSDYVMMPIEQDEWILRCQSLIQNKLLLDQVEQQHLFLEKITLTDSLTGLFNRHYFMEFGPKKFVEAQRQKQSLGLILVHTNQFKKINNTHGHDMGDAILAALAQRLKNNTRAEDLVARLDNKKFAIILNRCPREALIQKCEDLRQHIEQLMPCGIPITISCGFGHYLHRDQGLDDKQSFQKLLMIAEASLDQTRKKMSGN